MRERTFYNGSLYLVVSMCLSSHYAANAHLMDFYITITGTPRPTSSPDPLFVSILLPKRNPLALLCKFGERNCIIRLKI